MSGSAALYGLARTNLVREMFYEALWASINGNFARSSTLVACLRRQSRFTGLSPPHLRRHVDSHPPMTSDKSLSKCARPRLAMDHTVIAQQEL